MNGRSSKLSSSKAGGTQQTRAAYASINTQLEKGSASTNQPGRPTKFSESVLTGKKKTQPIKASAQNAVKLAGVYRAPVYGSA